MNTQRNIEERLWEFIDGHSSLEEKTVIERLLQTDTEWKAKYSELLEVNEMLQSSELEAPSMRFTKNVMEEIAKMHIAPATKSYINKRIIWGIGLFFMTMLVAILVYGFSQMDWSTGESSAITDKISKIDYTKFFNNTWVNAFMMINVLLGLVLLDNYFSNKRKQFRKEA
ncbi:MAG TPA: hypothetical protein PLO70_04140 [Chitinophagaceae bacterium]|nr:hypothetical protein [Chitinophagaceae bacterium]HQV85527.1 hypothetical protein [Chitinophagaceae bacterium]HQX72935.1 hypothetical protein [Chitinophagaceae bacterium]HQZ73676.1 hypothetical protein [Chitinophagaceae bacterium]